MSSIRDKLIDIIDSLPQQEQLLLFEIAKRILPDDAATEDDLKAIAAARDEYEQGATLDHNKIKWD